MQGKATAHLWPEIGFVWPDNVRVYAANYHGVMLSDIAATHQIGFVWPDNVRICAASYHGVTLSDIAATY
jgi:hypothetical protein